MEKDDSSSEPRPVVPDSTHWRAVRCMGTRDAAEGRRRCADAPVSSANGWTFLVATASYALSAATYDATAYRYTWTTSAPLWTSSNTNDTVHHRPVAG